MRVKKENHLFSHNPIQMSPYKAKVPQITSAPSRQVHKRQPIAARRIHKLRHGLQEHSNPRTYSDTKIDIVAS